MDHPSQGESAVDGIADAAGPMPDPDDLSAGLFANYRDHVEPPLIISEHEVRRAVEILEGALTNISRLLESAPTTP